MYNIVERCSVATFKQDKTLGRDKFLKWKLSILYDMIGVQVATRRDKV